MYREEIKVLDLNMITGILNEHPRAAIARRDSEDKDKYAEFYEEILDALES